MDDFTDDQLNRTCLTNCLPFLCDNLNSTKVLVCLEAKKILQQCEVQTIKGKGTQYESNNELINFVKQRGIDGFRCFMESLKESGQHSIHQKLVEERKRIAGLPTPGISTNPIVDLASIQQALRAFYLDSFKSDQPISALPFDFNVESKWVPLTIKLAGASESTEDHLDLLKIALERAKVLILEGDPSAGKTSLLRRFAYEWTKEKEEMRHYDLVLYAEFREVREKKFTSIIDMVCHYMNLHLHKKDYELFDRFMIDDRCYDHQILVLLDGYDESLLEQQCEELSEYLFARNPKRALRVQVVLTSRKGYLSKLHGITRFVFADVQGFTSKLQKEKYVMINSTIESSASDNSYVQNLVQSNQTLSTLSENPLMLAFICILHGKKAVRTEADLYMNIIWWLIDRYQQANENLDIPLLFGYSHNSSDKFSVIRDKYLHFPQLHSLGRMAMVDIFKSVFTENDLKQFKLDPVVQQVGLLRKEVKSDSLYRSTVIEFSFPHRTIQEFIMALTFFFAKEETTEQFCDCVFSFQRVIGSGIIQAKVYNYLQMIKSSNVNIDSTREEYFRKQVNRWNYNKQFIHHDLALPSPLKVDGVSKFQSRRQMASYGNVDLEEGALKTDFLRHAGEAAREYLQNIQHNSQFPLSIEEAILELKKAAEKGDPMSQHHLGALYETGEGIEQSYTVAVKWYTKAAGQGDTHSQHNLGYMYLCGLGVPQSYEEAAKWFRKAAEQGHANAQFHLALMYEKGRGVPQSDEEAVKWFTRAAEQGNASAQCNLGFMYSKGQGVPQSYEEAVKWFTMALEQENPELAENNLGNMYFNGFGVPQSHDEAIKLYRKAAERGNEDGQINLGFMYQSGLAVAQSDEKAMEWYRKAAKGGIVFGENNVGVTLDSRRNEFQVDNDAREWFRKVAEQLHADGQRKLKEKGRKQRTIDVNFH